MVNSSYVLTISVFEIKTRCTSLCSADDQSIGNILPWRTKLEATNYQTTQIAVVQSNVWPGAWAFAIDKYI
jgi:hypothetical protein